jgi:hypothetical protein
MILPCFACGTVYLKFEAFIYKNTKIGLPTV